MIGTIAVAESSIGVVYHKGLVGMLGTAVGAFLGLGTLYFAVLCNGLSHGNSPGKVCRRGGVRQDRLYICVVLSKNKLPQVLCT